jgi:hypothetical protein
MHEYKEQLYENLKQHLEGSGWKGVKHFEFRGEIQLILPEDLDVNTEFKKVYTLLESLPEIDHPRERVVISYSHKAWKNYKSVVINPTKQDIMLYRNIGVPSNYQV